MFGDLSLAHATLDAAGNIEEGPGPDQFKVPTRSSEIQTPAQLDSTIKPDPVDPQLATRKDLDKCEVIYPTTRFGLIELGECCTPPFSDYVFL